MTGHKNAYDRGGAHRLNDIAKDQLNAASGEFLTDQGRLVADSVEGAVIKGSGHWLIDVARRAWAPAVPQSWRGTA